MARALYMKGEMEIYESASYESSKIAQPQPYADGTYGTASETTLPRSVARGDLKKRSFYAVAGVILLLSSVIVGCLIFIEQQSRQQLLAPVPPAQIAAQPEPTPPEDIAPPPKKRRVAKLKPDTPWKVAVSANPQALPVELSINTQPEGARAQIDGRSNADWVTPYVADQLAPGKHTVTVSKAGYRSESRNVDLPAGKRLSLFISLTYLGALIDISSQPSNASVLVDGAETGRVTPTQIAVPQGYHTLTLRRAGYFDAARKLNVGPGEEPHLDLAMEPIRGDVEVRPVTRLRRITGKVPTGMGWVQIKTAPKGAQILINGRALEEPAPSTFLLEIGDYQVTLSLKGYKPVQRVIHIDEGSKIEVNEMMERSY